MKSNANIKIIILITLGIVFALAPMITINLSFITSSSNKSSEYSDDINFDKENLKISAVSGKIYINGNSGWAAFRSAGNCTGNGTYSEPYVIEDLVIDANNTGNCILIENSDVYFRIENCTVYNSGEAPGQNKGIGLHNSTNGKLINNNCSYIEYGIVVNGYNITVSGNNVSYNDRHGILVSLSNNITVTGNFVSYNEGYGIIVDFCSNVTIWGNIMTECGLYIFGIFGMLTSLIIDTTNLVNGKPLYYYTNEINLGPNNFTDAGQVILVNCNDSLISDLSVSHGSVGISLIICNNNTISGNTVSYNDMGIYLQYSNHNTVSENTANNNSNGIYLFASNDNAVSGNALNNNSNGIYLVLSDDNTLSGNAMNNNINGIYLVLSDDNTVSRNAANYNDIGIVMESSVYNIVSGNNYNYNGNFGIWLNICDYNNITGNIVQHNGDVGIKVYVSSHNVITGNMVEHNGDFGIEVLGSSFNNIYLNCFNNSINAYCDSTPNDWDNGVKGNYWADYTGLDENGDEIGDSPYVITGPAVCADRFPLMKCSSPAQDSEIIPIEQIVLISVISGAVVIGVATLLLFIRKRKRIQ